MAQEQKYLRAVAFCKLATDVVVVKLFITFKFFTAIRESNDRQTFDCNSKLVSAKHWTYQTLSECINASVMILPIEKYKLG